MGGLLTFLRWRGDPDHINPDVGLSKRDIYNIQRSWAPIYKNSYHYGLQIFLRLFRQNPATKTIFPIRDMTDEQIKNSPEFRAHVNMVMTSINMVVDNLQQLAAVTEILLNKIGKKHKTLQVEPQHFDEMKTVIIGMLKNDLSADDEVVSAWTRLMTTKSMLQLYGQH